ncbi:Lrp/AsnC family transcriptional regulator [Aquicoccus sp. G2-2]|uniref:Lrp/AsnC family transcriptional regulator n=1 Tax=Aquicoccus sp. G2-2 TaxID=3092120 RepID=UPI002ADFD6AF|nr:Lrp/AsnC family transcriptional regulator [Aquicoccus sp. G2-2]MEA1115069.1 Lrp/AsnC family transcriptional regulator [Aquicoccus sp. G2-2]
MNLDPRDKHLLALLQTDCRLSNAELAERVGMSASACWRRVRAFEEQGIVERYKAEVSPQAVGLAFQALVHVQLTRHIPEHLSQFITAIEARPEVLDCYATTGQGDYYMRVLCRDIAAYNAFLEDFLFCLPAVQSAQTNVVLREIKRSYAISV